MTFDELYLKLCKSALVGDLDKVKEQIGKGESHNMDCLLNSKKHPIILNTSPTPCDCSDHKCVSTCLFNAITVDNGVMTIDKEKCVGCSACVDSCESKKLQAGKELIDVILELKSNKAPIYALVAPAVTGQFGDSASIGKIRAALKAVGFAGVVEVATFADILTLREAIEFSHMSNQEQAYQLTSCCCPVWIALIKKVFQKLSSHLTPAVSPMIAAGRCIKRLNSNAINVFISPCLAKRAEAKEPDVQGAIDYVLTFSELNDLFNLSQIDVEEYDDEEKEHASYAGRIYAKTGGVSDAVAKTYARIMEGESCKPLVAKQANGIPECKAMLNDIVEGKISANFYEGMGCKGGCVGGPKTCRPVAETEKLVEKYALESNYEVPIDNPYVVKILSDLGFNKIGDLLKDESLFCRKI